MTVLKRLRSRLQEYRRINDRVQDFKGKIGKIEEIVDLVKKVANQSNLLALNASVEAARAGESGKALPSLQTRCASCLLIPQSLPKIL